MHTHERTRLLGDRNAIAPYVWVAEYVGGGRLQQFDVDGFHHSTEIKAARVRRLVLLGPGLPELALTAPVPPEAVWVLCRRQMISTVGADGMDQRRIVIVGMRWADGSSQELHVDEDGRVTSHATRGTT